jgi:diguanylate cyclase (GGDEF)-like protein
VNHEIGIVGLTVQWGGIAIVTILLFLMAQSLRRRFLEYWTLGWACLTLSLTSLLIAFGLPVPPKAFYSVYFFGAYLFAYLFVAGCRNYGHDEPLTPGRARVLVPAALLALGLPYLSDSFYVLLVPHACVLAVFWFVAFRLVQRARREDHRGAGTRVLSVGLIMMIVNQVHYALMYAYTELSGSDGPFAYLNYSPLYDLLLQIVLAFGIVILVLEKVCRQLEGENHALTATSAHLQAMAEKDPLTETLNRWAFYCFLQKHQALPGEQPGGTVALVDVDDFKTINDTLGHAAGDAAIRAVARSIRSIIRADDLLFRWGGDEFLVVLVGVDEVEARARLDGLNVALSRTVLNDVDQPVDLLVSYGVAAFEATAHIEQTIEVADREMYNQKQARKARAALAASPADNGEPA